MSLMNQLGEGVGVAPWVLIELGWSAKSQPPPGVWQSKSGARTTGDPRFGLPYRHDRLTVLSLALEGRRHGASFGANLQDIPAPFGQRERPDTTRARLQRVAHCWYERPERPGLALSIRHGFVDRLDLCPTSGDFAITLSAAFMTEIAAGAPIAIPIVRALAAKPGTLDLYLWQAAHLAKLARANVADSAPTATTIPICGPGGPCAILPCAADPSRAEQEIREHNALIRSAWPDSPYTISPDGKMLRCTLA